MEIGLSLPGVEALVALYKKLRLFLFVLDNDRFIQRNDLITIALGY